MKITLVRFKREAANRNNLVIVNKGQSNCSFVVSGYLTIDATAVYPLSQGDNLCVRIIFPAVTDTPTYCELFCDILFLDAESYVASQLVCRERKQSYVNLNPKHCPKDLDPEDSEDWYEELGFPSTE